MEVLEINEGLRLGSVHRPMVGVTGGDMPKVEAAAARMSPRTIASEDQPKQEKTVIF